MMQMKPPLATLLMATALLLVSGWPLGLAALALYGVHTVAARYYGGYVLHAFWGMQGIFAAVIIDSSTILILSAFVYAGWLWIGSLGAPYQRA